MTFCHKIQINHHIYINKFALIKRYLFLRYFIIHILQTSHYADEKNMTKNG